MNEISWDLVASVYGTAHAHKVPQAETAAKNRTWDPRWTLGRGWWEISPSTYCISLVAARRVDSKLNHAA